MDSGNKKSIIEYVNEKLFLKKYDIIPFIPYFLFLPAFMENDYSVYFAFSASILGIATVLVCYVIRPERKNHEKDEHSHKGSGGGKFFLIFGAIYVIIAGVAFTHGIDTFLMNNDIFTSTQDASDLINFIQNNQTILFYSFFAVAILFFHCGLLFLSIEGIRYLTAGEDSTGKKNKGNEIIFCNVILLFAEAIILYFIADSVQSISRFALWVMVLMSIDIFWTILQRFVFIKKQGKWEDEVPFEWIHLDLLTFGFLWFLLLAFHSDSHKISDAVYYWFLLSVLLSSTAVNYTAMWRRIWSKIRIESTG